MGKGAIGRGGGGAREREPLDWDRQPAVGTGRMVSRSGEGTERSQPPSDGKSTVCIQRCPNALQPRKTR